MADGESATGAPSGYPVDRRPSKLRLQAEGQPFGDVEAQAGRIVARLTGGIVTLQDDNRGAHGKPDLHLRYRDGRTAAIEVVTDIDPGRAAVIQASREDHTRPPSRRLISGPLPSPRLAHVWWIGLKHARSLKELRAEIEGLLLEADARMPGDQWTSPENPGASWERRLTAFGVTDVTRGPLHDPGEIRLLPLPAGGSTVDDEAAFLDWIHTYLTHPARGDVLGKLRSAQTDERHCFIGCTDSTDWAVIGSLEADRTWLPLQSPPLSPPLTHLWLYNVEVPGRCLHFSPTYGWIDAQTRWRTP